MIQFSKYLLSLTLIKNTTIPLIMSGWVPLVIYATVNIYQQFFSSLRWMDETPKSADDSVEISPMYIFTLKSIIEIGNVRRYVRFLTLTQDV